MRKIYDNTKKIKILGQIYELEEVDYIQNNEKGIVLGEINYSENKILILNKLKEDKKKIMVLHEVLHGIFSGLGMEEMEDERLICSLSESLYLFLKENEWLK